jgi:hypothetical protein
MKVFADQTEMVDADPIALCHTNMSILKFYVSTVYINMSRKNIGCYFDDWRGPFALAARLETTDRLVRDLF